MKKVYNFFRIRTRIRKTFTIFLGTSVVLGLHFLVSSAGGESSHINQKLQKSLGVSLSFSTFLGAEVAGSSGELFESVFDSAGNIISVGAGDFSPADYPGVPVKTFGTLDDRNVIVAKLSKDGAQLHWVTLLGGSGYEKMGYGIGLDANEYIYIAGTTHSSDFPTTAGAFDETYNGGGQPGPNGGPGAEGFLAKLSPDGQNLIYSTFLGGSQGGETARGGLAVDSLGFAYVAGTTQSDDFLEGASSGNPANKVNDRIGGFGDGFITKVSQDGASIVYSRFIGSPNDTQHGDVVVGVRVDGMGNAYLNTLIRGTGAETTADAYDSDFNGGESDSYFAKLSPDGKQLLYATYFGGGGSEYAEHRIALDDSGFVTMCGWTDSTNFPIINGHQSQMKGSNDLYLIKFDPTGQPVFSTYLGGSAADDNCGGPELDGSGNIYVAGLTSSSDFEVTADAVDATYNGNGDVFMQIYSTSGQLLYSTFYGGSGHDRARYVGVDPFGDPVVVGWSGSQSTDFPTTPGAYDQTHNGGIDVFVVKFDVSSNSLPTPIPSDQPPPTNFQYLPVVVGSIDKSLLIVFGDVE